MKPDTSEWNTSGLYGPLEDMEIGGLAWECLRRNALYQADYARLAASSSQGAIADKAIGDRWGLRFRRPSRIDQPRAADLLAA